jgi:hypothetical protein
MWQLHDNTYGKKGGYLSILKDGVRVADVFPFAAKADEAWVRQQAKRIVDQMNAVDLVETSDPRVSAIDARKSHG